jgi:hypothetical protein
MLAYAKSCAVKDVLIRSVENDEELRQAVDLMVKSHGDSPADACAWLRGFGAGYPGYRREHTRVALVGSQVVAALRLTTDTIRIGEARLKMGGIGWVSTDGAWRRRGIVSRVMTDTLRYMHEQRYHVSMLFGVPDFHRRWGFASTLTEYTTVAELPKLDRTAPAFPFKVRAAKPGDIQAMQKMHAANDAETACSLIRTQAHLSNRWKPWESVRVLTDGRGKLSAYFHGFRSDFDYIIDEAGVSDAEAGAGVLLEAARLAREAGAKRLRFCMPPNHPLVRGLKPDKAGRPAETIGDSSGMMAFVHLGEALESMIPEWENRLLQTPLTGSHAEFTLMVGRSAWRVRAHHGAVDVSSGSGPNKAVVSAQELIQLTAGFRDLEEVLAARRRIINAEGMALLRAIFPRRIPYVWMFDRF